MKWLGKLFKWVWRGVKEVVKTVFRWAYENPSIGFIVGGAVLVYGIISRQDAYSFVGASILLASTAGYFLGGIGKSIQNYGEFMLEAGVAG